MIIALETLPKFQEAEKKILKFVKYIIKNKNNNVELDEINQIITDESIYFYYSFYKEAKCASNLICKLFEIMPEKHFLDRKKCFQGGLLYNVGMILLEELFKEESNLLQRWFKIKPKVSVRILEKKILGLGNALKIFPVGHEGLGYYLANLWNLPEEILVMIKEHHNHFYEGKHKEYVYLLQLVDQILKQHSIGHSIKHKIDCTLLKKLKISKENVINISEEIMLETEINTVV